MNSYLDESHNKCTSTFARSISRKNRKGIRNFDRFLAIMSKRTIFTTVTALPDGISREAVLETLHDHLEMIDLNPLVTERHPIKPPPEATPEEYHAQWYSVTDKVNYLPGGLYSGAVTFNGCFHDLPNGLQSHIYAPMGLNMKGKWTLGGTLPGEPREPVELGLGVPKTGLWLREDVDMKCNFVMTKFVKGTTKKAHTTLVQRLVEKAHLIEAQAHNSALGEQLSLRESYPPEYHAAMMSPTQTQYFDGKPLNVQAGSRLSSGSNPMTQSPPVGGGPSPQGLNPSYFNPHGQQKAPHDPRFSYASRSSYRRSDDSYVNNAAPTYQNPNLSNTNNLAVELPSHDAKTPIELDTTRRQFSGQR